MADPVGGIGEHRDLLRRGERSVVEHITRVLDDIEARDPQLHAFVAVGGAECLRDAARADIHIRRYGPDSWQRMPLLGVPIGVKDLIQTADLPTRRGSLLPNNRPRVDAPAVARLRAAGAIIIGKTATSEYGWSAGTTSRLAPATRNPWDPQRSAGGSSGGAAAAVAAGLCAAGLGTDGAGSIRIPAAFCGVVGYKPSFGRIPYVPPCADRLAHLGPLSTTVADAAELAQLISGPHERDPDSLHLSVRAPLPATGLRIGWVELPGTSGQVRAVAARGPAALSAQGHQVDLIEPPYPDPYPVLVDLLAAAESAACTEDDERLADAGRLAVVGYGRSLDAAAVVRAEEARLELRARMAVVMQDYDLLAMVTVPIEPFDVDAIAPPWAADPADLNWLAWSPGTYPANLTGQPAISLPLGRTAAGLPVGLQLVADVGADDLLLTVAQRTEAVLGPLPTPLRKG
ncbi:MAG TPA: amidase family protein [Actinoplanes sp.]|nr:amidase family protein [Actinoplanes sp.]